MKQYLHINGVVEVEFITELSSSIEEQLHREVFIEDVRKNFKSYDIRFEIIEGKPECKRIIIKFFNEDL